MRRLRSIHPLLRAAIIIPIVGSVLVHAAVWWGLINIRVGRAERLTDSPAESVLTFTPPAPRVEPVVQPRVQPPPPPPAPKPELKPEPKPEPVPPQPAEVALDRSKTDEPTPAAPVEAPRPAPAAVAPVTPVPAQPAGPEPAPASFAGVKGPRASRIVYIVDASGAMTSSLPFVLAELDRSVSRLTTSQSFQVIVFREPPRAAAGKKPMLALEVFDDSPARGMVRATDDNKQRLRSWLAGVQPSGRSDPREALVAALNLRPELVFLLTRSIKRSGPEAPWAGGNKAVLDALDKLNPIDARTQQRAVVIKAIQFIDDDPTGLLKSIGAQHGDGEGSYRVMRLEELDPQPEPAVR